jgi:hypothetical protein
MSDCSEPERRQFDFWLGLWDVHDPDGNLAGRNRIIALFDGCALREEWHGASGFRGTSLNSWSPQSGRWHQTWVDSSGLLLRLDGELRDGSMVMEGEAPLPGQGARVLRHRISWSPTAGNPDRLRQHWEVNVEDGAWETVFDGRYRRAAD